MKALPPSVVAECLRYDPETGELMWKERPRRHFGTSQAHGHFNATVAGTVARARSHGYIRVAISYCGVVHLLYGHRIAYCLMLGKWPDALLDHRDGDGTNNRWGNLRAASKQDNNRNCAARSNSPTGLKWAYPTRAGRFRAAATVDGKQRNFGRFDTAEEAHAAAATALLSLHGKFFNAGVPR